MQRLPIRQATQMADEALDLLVDRGVLLSTALSLQHGAKICDAFSVIPFASGLLQEPVADAAMHFRQWQAPTVGPRGKKAGACARAGGLAAYVATPA